MAKLFSASIDVKKIIKERLFEGEKGTYLNLTISLNDEVDDYGNIISIQQSISKEEKDGGMAKNYLGNGKMTWTNEGDDLKAEAKQSAVAPSDDDGDSLPF